MEKKYKGDDIRLEKLTDDKTEEYLKCKKHASIFSNGYENLDGLWEYMKSGIVESIHDGNNRMLVYNKMDECIGYIESERDNRGICGISVGILPEFRNQNAATIASKKFVEYLFAETDIPTITWYAHKSNVASCRVAEKIGGKYVGQGDLLKSTMELVGFSVENMDMLEEVAYLIERNINN